MMGFISTKIQKVSPLLLVVVLAMATRSWGAGEDGYKQIALPGCQDECGGVKIPYPFGIGDGCFLINLKEATPIDTYKINCTNTSSSTNPKPFSPTFQSKEILGISIQDHTIRVSLGAAYDCSFTSESVPSTVRHMDYSTPLYYAIPEPVPSLPFQLSSTRNKLVAIGCQTSASFRDPSTDGYIGGCTTSCTGIPNKMVDGTCNSLYGCCETILNNTTSPFIHVYNSYLENSCGYAFVGEVGSYNFSSTNLTVTPVDCFNFRVNVVYDWFFLPRYSYENCSVAKADGYQDIKKSCSSNSMVQCGNDYDYYYEFSNLVFTCKCLEGYNGNPYLPHGCQDINECEDEKLNKCEKQKYCVNTEGGYECKCPKGYVGDTTTLGQCTFGGSKLIIGFSIGVGSMIGFIMLYGMFKLIKRRKEMIQKTHNFKRNGGLLLQQEMTTNEGVIDKTKIFTHNELVKATDNFNENRFLGRGGQGTVYKGMLEDGTIVAVKKSEKVDEDQLAQFINEVVILSQINHRNIVRLFGCCLETDVPLLVYEFVHNGTLHQHIHHPTEDFHMTWEARLRIAAECAGAVAYLHSSCSSPIYHRDIKSSNILLDEKYNAKISDFGISRSISIEKTHVTTCVQGTFGYLDPEFFRSSQFSAKSDVYSFGVVLLELLTSKKSIFTSTLGETRGLAIEFTQIMETSPNQLHGILDKEVLEHCSEENVEALTEIIQRCLSMNLRQRPTMKEVAITLEMIKKSQIDKEGNHTLEQEIIMQVEEDDSDNTSEDIYANNSSGDRSYSVSLKP